MAGNKERAGRCKEVHLAKALKGRGNLHLKSTEVTVKGCCHQGAGMALAWTSGTPSPDYVSC